MNQFLSRIQSLAITGGMICIALAAYTFMQNKDARADKRAGVELGCNLVGQDGGGRYVLACREAQSK